MISMTSHVESISLKVNNIDNSVAFLTNSFGMKQVNQVGDKIVIRSPNQKFPSFVIEARKTSQKVVASDDKTNVRLRK